MNRLQVNDLVMGAYLEALETTVSKDTADKAKKIYEVQRVEIMANGGDSDKDR